MRQPECDVLVIGSGFGGSLVARILAALGRRVVVLERDAHPRFSIGESSTPVADRILRDLCQRYGLDDLEPLTRYGSARRVSEVVVGPKRGFTYIDSSRYQPSSLQVSEHEMLVAASSSAESSDTHWLRSSVDRYFAQSLARAGVMLFEQTAVTGVAFDSATATWTVSAQCRDTHETCVWRAAGIIDASGAGSPMAQALGLRTSSDRFRTWSGAVFGHVRGWKKMDDLTRDCHMERDRHPYPMDDAALHHIAPDGWLWQLAFDNAVTSVGWCVSCERLPLSSVETESWWKARLQRFEWLSRQACESVRIEPVSAWGLIPRMQFERSACAGEGWWMLPGAAGFVDPLHSSGIAHTMVAIERLAMAFESLGSDQVPGLEWSKTYEQAMSRELHWIDRLVSIAYRTMHDFALFTLASMLYFAAAVHYERLRGGALQGMGPLEASGKWPDFLAANDRRLTHAIERAEALILAAAERSGTERPAAERSVSGRLEALDRAEVIALQCELRRVLEPINHAGLLDPSTHPYYSHTAAPDSFIRLLE